MIAAVACTRPINAPWPPPTRAMRSLRLSEEFVDIRRSSEIGRRGFASHFACGERSILAEAYRRSNRMRGLKRLAGRRQSAVHVARFFKGREPLTGELIQLGEQLV